MSYYFEMRFFQLPKNENPALTKLAAFEKVAELVQLLGEDRNAFHLIDQNLWFLADRLHVIPESAVNIMIRFKLLDLFSMRFVFWEQFGLLGVVGERWPEALTEVIPFHQSFQNSTDQDYEFESWSGIRCFEDIVSDIRAMSSEEVKLNYKEKRGYDEEDADGEDCVDDDYLRQSLCYNTIYDQLDLDKWLYGHDGNFQRITMNAIQTQEQHFDLLVYTKNRLKSEGYLKD